ncbi:acyltransferase family protein [Fundicoccus sp. Sow4_F4]|uniref:acyltransferase family protein n=1 Tax=Fundicoccus sp. Sow4_F4 TaxID=3438783 RepID=UPI003F926B29
MSKMQRIPSFDGLKGLAIVSIIAYHLFPSVIPGGFLMVNTFLVISGYFFARKMEQIPDINYKINWSRVWQYLKKTVERLFIPVFWMILLVVVGLLLFYPQELKHIQSDVFSGLFFYNNIFQISAERSYFVQMTNASPFTHLWYNALYLQSFLVSIPLILLTRQLKLSVQSKAVFWLVLVLLSHLMVWYLYSPGEDPSRVYYGLSTRLSSFAIGIAAAYVTPYILKLISVIKEKRVFYNIIGVLTAIDMLFLILITKDQADITYHLWLPAFNIFSMILVFLISVRTQSLSVWLSLPPLTAIGKRSYAYYLWYYPIIVFMMSQFRIFNGNMTWINLASIVAIAIVGELFYRLIERQGIYFWFGSSFNFKEDAADLKRMFKESEFNKKKLLAFIAYMILLLLFAIGLLQTANNKRLTQFQLEYQAFQTATNIQGDPYPLEEGMIETKERLLNVDDVLDTHLLAERPLRDFHEELMKITDEAQAVSAEAQRIYSENQAVFNQIEASSPLTFELLPPEVLLFASEVPVTFFGDSLVFLSGPQAMDVFLNGNHFGQANLQIWDAVDIMIDLINQGFVKENVVIVLGTNAGLDEDGMTQLIEAAGERQLFFVNTNSRVMHIDEVNTMIKEFTKAYSNVHEVDWYNAQQGHPEWYDGDDIHHSPEVGRANFNALVAEKMFEVLESANNN